MDRIVDQRDGSGTVFSIFCERHGARVLLDLSRTWRLEGDDGQYHLHWVCWCGADGVLTVPAQGGQDKGGADGRAELIETS
jgi:hypothetical protein